MSFSAVKNARAERRICSRLKGIETAGMHLLEVGFHATGNDFKVGPRRVGSFGIVYVQRGKGWVTQLERTEVITGGEIFIIFPRTLYAFAAVEQSWDVYWLSFKSAGLQRTLRSMDISPRDFIRRPSAQSHIVALFSGLLQSSESSDPRRRFQIIAQLLSLLQVLSSPADSSAVVPAPRRPR